MIHTGTPNLNRTTDTTIRKALIDILSNQHAKDEKVRIIPEFQVHHGLVRVDIAVVNGVMHGYEIKSDCDTLLRLPEQIRSYNSVFDKVTIVVGKTHLYDVLHMVPDWWGIRIAKVSSNNTVLLHTIRTERDNPAKDSVSVAQLLWRQEALSLLEEASVAKGLRSKPRAELYERLSVIFDQPALCAKVRDVIFSRDWRPDSPLLQSGG